MPKDLISGYTFLSSSMMNGIAREIAPRSSAADLNQPYLNEVLLQRTMLSQSGESRGDSRCSIAKNIWNFEQLDD